MKRRELHIAELPRVSHEFAQELSRKFPRKEVKPGIEKDELLYNAGERNIIDYILRSASGTTISSDITEIRPDKNSKSLLQRMLGNK